MAFAHAGVDELEAETRARLARHPDSPQAHLERAAVLQMERDWDGALAALEDAAARGADPDVVGARKGGVYLEAGFPRMAKIEIDRVLARRPAAYDLLADRARAWLALGNPEAAARDFGEAIAKGTRPTPELVLARRDALAAAGKPEDALGALDAGMTRVGPVVSLVLPAVDLEVELGRYDAALARLDRLAGNGPPNPLWQARRGDILERAGRPAEARTEWARTLALLDARPPARQGTQLDDLRRRMQAALASTDQGGKTK
jgi:tetratricopeptide (TPR) repeat protein